MKSEIITFLKDNNRLPSVKSNDLHERNLAHCLTSYRDEEAGAYDPEFIEILNENFPELFNL